MFQSELFIDLETEDVLSRETRRADQPFAALEEQVEDDEMITFVVDAREYADRFEAAFNASQRVAEVRRVDDTRLVVTKQANGALPIIRENHGKLNGIDLIHGTKRLFTVLTFRRTDIRDIFEQLETIGTVRLERLVPIERRTRALSDRQREAITLAFENGYYDWPRQTEGVELADRMGVAHSTYLEHLRKAEQKLVGQSLRNDKEARVSEQRQSLVGTTEG